MQKPPDLPKAERELLDTSDPWGLPFSDQLIRFQAYFASAPGADFVVGFTHNLVKIWPNKYWFRGAVVNGRESTRMEPLIAASGSVASFQLAVLPGIGARKSAGRVRVTAPFKPVIHRQEQVRVGSPAYPVFQSEFWPDPLVAEDGCEITGTKAAVFLVEIPIPEDFCDGSFLCEVTVSGSPGQRIRFSVPVAVVKLKLRPNRFPLVAHFEKLKLSDRQFREMCRMVLAHHLQPFSPNYLQELWQKRGPAEFDEFIRFARKNGQTVFQIAEPDPQLYRHLRQKGELADFMVYSNADEPAARTFYAENVPYAQKIRKRFPGLKIFLASEYHDNMARGCDVWLTDLSSSRYDPRTFVIPKKPALWHYYCGVPIHLQLRAPFNLAPGMMIDHPALAHRLALWISRHFGARGVLIWSGNLGWNSLEPDFWRTLNVNPQQYHYPHGGVRHGDGFLVYPPEREDGVVRPSLRLKILRDAVEDIAVFEAVREAFGKKAEHVLSPAPDVFCHPHYYDNLPEILLQKRDSILRKCREWS